jgi:hypothetical protein
MEIENPGVVTNDLIQDLPVAIYSCDVNGYITHYNKMAAMVWGRNPVIGKDKWWRLEAV